MSAAGQIHVVAGRSCGGCTLCCKVMAIGEPDKPADQWCPHCAPGTGCKVYETRPDSCQGFQCAYLVSRHLGEEWRPDRAKMVVVIDDVARKMVAYVDPQRPTAWKAEPYYAQLKQWAKNSLPRDGQVIASVGRRLYLITPSEDIDLGVLGEDEVIEISGERDAAGTRFVAHNISKGGTPD